MGWVLTEGADARKIREEDSRKISEVFSFNIKENNLCSDVTKTFLGVLNRITHDRSNAQPITVVTRNSPVMDDRSPHPPLSTPGRASAALKRSRFLRA
ncbi:hypothetical protein CEXT_759331 [Caerostris extrusa]|uniref:Uncharacterized protein n=1 Tax=Caerostris extrusa TaxID=172846 RepID=A0AAV4VJ34_CAEEX|nr:hypothetical protein CEXT_759331 [Caerostris extrusa]